MVKKPQGNFEWGGGPIGLEGEEAPVFRRGGGPCVTDGYLNGEEAPVFKNCNGEEAPKLFCY